MNKLWHKMYFLLVALCSVSLIAHAQHDFTRIDSNIRSYLTADVDPVQLKQEVNKLWETLQANGSWPGIDYTSRAETNWMPLLHLNRIKQFAVLQALTLSAADVTKQMNVRSIHALRYWLQVNPKSNNWFQNDIAVPTAIGEILLLFKNNKFLPTTLQDSLLAQMKRGNVVKAIGANKLDIAVHMIYRACIAKDQMVMDSAVHQAFLPINLHDKEGLQPDYSYRQHGPQLQIASYGQVFLMGAYKVASWLKGTPYALPTEKLKILDRYFIHTFLKTIRGRYIDFNTEGRGIARNEVLDKLNLTSKGGKHSLFNLAKEVNPANAEVLRAAEQRIAETAVPSLGIVPAHSYFYKSDYTLHLRPSYSFNVRTVSKRTIRTEMGNKENLVGKFLPDGATNIQRSGKEYFNLMPIWEWDKIPGVTSRDYPIDEKTTLEWGERGVGAFTGGVTDGQYGATVYELNYNEVTAKKAWFFFDQEVVCLGAGINSFAKEPITTTVNQTWQKGSIKASSNNQVFNVNKGFNAKTLQWVWHDSVGYYFPNMGQLSLSTGKQTGNWAQINANRSKLPIEGNVFKLWFNHGVDPLNQSYAYIVKPGLGEADMVNTKLPDIRIVANSASIQAVEHHNLQMVQIVFYEAGTLKGDGYSLTADQACVLLIRDIRSANPVLYLSDPTQTLTDLHVSFTSSLLQITEPIAISLPQGDNKGATTRFPLSSF